MKPYIYVVSWEEEPVEGKRVARARQFQTRWEMEEAIDGMRERGCEIKRILCYHDAVDITSAVLNGLPVQ